MTTKIIVNALCTDDKEVVITTSEECEECDEMILQNGDTETFYVYDEKEVKVKEQLKD